MMEKFHDDRREWERRHDETWLGRYGGGVGTGVSMQVDLLSPVGIYDMVQNPSTFNLMKLGYVPALNFAGASLVSMAVGEKITFTHRLTHSVDMTYRFYKGMAVTGARMVPPVAAGAGLLAGAWSLDAFMSWLNPGISILPDADFMRWTRFG